MALYILLALETDNDTRAFLDYLHELPANPSIRELRAASQPKDGKVTIRKFKVRAAYLKEY